MKDLLQPLAYTEPLDRNRGAMRSFGIAIVVAVLLAIGFAVLNANQKTAQEEFSTEAVRL